ncbi:glycoside-pentoside-hexuronide (GPH):cation symporter [Haploplasma modicum]|uniref:glycoside-pentoside-hexuronide (GPH):cation symporter n=1 Tax=Haploplasma modicum TaxID=2150 RepID=UPI00214B2170|nr:glycoside-pentoside-hexuronide (GPH):cation symporter [Haploplasma modicum]MCR1808802.1 glycoside-pentoside-hexuronide (GPH):cation symporter [Haploplasma modicum]
MNDKVSNKTKYTYTISCMGRDMAYTLFSSYLLVFFTSAIGLSNFELAAVTLIISLTRIWDAVNDPMMGIMIDNTKSKYGKFRPWIAIGALLSSIFIFLLFQDFGLRGVPFLIVFAVLYLLIEITFTMNDIAYWSMYPSFTTHPKERESIGSLARIFASVGMFIVIALVPLIYPNFKGGPKRGFFYIALVVSLLFVISQIILFFFVKEKKLDIVKEDTEKTKFKDIIKIIFKNDQLIVIIVSILLLNTGYFITTSLGIYFFEYDFNKYGGVEFTLFSVVLAVSQLLALIIFPSLVKKFNRKKLFTLAILLMIVGYLFLMSTRYILPQNMIVLSIGGFFLFFGQGFTQVLVLVMLADTIEYGQWKLGTRNESVIFSINPFVVKLATSIQTLIVGGTLIISGMNEKVIKPLSDKMNGEFKDLPNDEKNLLARAFIDQNMTDYMRLFLRLSMIVIPIICIIVGYLVYVKYYKIDNEMYQTIITDLKERNKEELA